MSETSKAGLHAEAVSGRIAELKAEVERLRLLLNRVKGTERSTSHDDVFVRFSNQDWDEIREWALAE